MREKRSKGSVIAEVLGWVVALSVFVVPFLFMLTNSLKDRRGANQLALTLPEVFHWENYMEVIQYNSYEIMRAFKNSAILTVLGVFTLIVCGAMAGYVMQRRKGRVVKTVNAFIMIGLMVPASILPTIWIMQTLGIYKTLFSMVMIEAALNLPFTIMLYRGFMDTIPTELEEAGVIDGCNNWQIFSRIVFPLLKPVSATVIILNAVTIFNDFTNPLYFYPGRDNVTVQLTLYNYMGQYSSSYNLLFANVILITIPMLILFLFFNKRIIAGMVAGAVKG